MRSVAAGGGAASKAAAGQQQAGCGQQECGQAGLCRAAAEAACLAVLPPCDTSSRRLTPVKEATCREAGRRVGNVE